MAKEAKTKAAKTKPASSARAPTAAAKPAANKAGEKTHAAGKAPGPEYADKGGAYAGTGHAGEANDETTPGASGSEYDRHAAERPINVDPVSSAPNYQEPRRTDDRPALSRDESPHRQNVRKAKVAEAIATLIDELPLLATLSGQGQDLLRAVERAQNQFHV